MYLSAAKGHPRRRICRLHNFLPLYPIMEARDYVKNFKRSPYSPTIPMVKRNTNSGPFISLS